jgi:hypothetical protein
MKKLIFIPVVAVVLVFTGCGEEGNRGECDLLAPDCAEGLVCDPTAGGKPHCVPPVIIRGDVLDATDDSGIAGALVQAADPNGAATGSSDETGSGGGFTLTVPATRDQDGAPLEGSYTLRVQAAGYQRFPTAIRPALPLDATAAVKAEGAWVIENAITTLLLLPLPGGTTGLGSISGTITAERHGGILVVAETATEGFTGFSDALGDYTIFNVPAGSYFVNGYSQGVQIEPVAVTLSAGDKKTGVDLSESQNPLSTVSGNVQIVNAPGGAQTSVVLAVESTFVEAAARGEVPPGLRVGAVDSGFSIENVPDGRYVVLAAFENDDLVRDPDQTIGGTRIVHIQVPDPTTGNTVTLPEGFKVTEALAVTFPGAEGPEAVDTLTPTFIWADDSSEEGYEVYVFDAFGNEIWNEEIGPVSGSETVEHTYAGPTLEAGMYYQFKAVSFREKTGERTAISATEDLRGVFYYVSNP